MQPILPDTISRLKKKNYKTSGSYWGVSCLLCYNGKGCEPNGNFHLCLHARGLYSRVHLAQLWTCTTGTYTWTSSAPSPALLTATSGSQLSWPCQKPALEWEELSSSFSALTTKSASVTSSNTNVTPSVFTFSKATSHGIHFITNWRFCLQTTIATHNSLNAVLLGESRMVAALKSTTRQRKPTLLSVVPVPRDFRFWCHQSNLLFITKYSLEILPVLIARSWKSHCIPQREGRIPPTGCSSSLQYI